jgi:hypothetical protein
MSLLQWWEKCESMFSIVEFFVFQILSIVSSQIETKMIFSLARIFINFKRCHLQSNNLLIFVNKYWPNEPRIACKPFSNFMELIETNAKLEEEFFNFEKTF